MSQFVVHTVPGSPFGRTVMAALEETGDPGGFHGRAGHGPLT